MALSLPRGEIRSQTNFYPNPTGYVTLATISSDPDEYIRLVTLHALSEPHIDDRLRYDAIAAAKHVPRRTLLQAMRADIFNAYRHYKSHAPQFSGLPALALTDDQIEALIHAFEVSTVPMSELRELLTAGIFGARCALCGLGEPSDLDHYLPKKLHPQFSILSRNLIPSCSNCNRRKSQKVMISGTNVRRFLHPYYDNIPNQRFLTASITLNPTYIAVNFRVTCPIGMPNRVFQQLRSHFFELDLKERYRQRALLHMSDERWSYRRWFEQDATGERLAKELADKAAEYANDYGCNYWLSVLYTVLSEHVEFCSGNFDALDMIRE